MYVSFSLTKFRVAVVLIPLLLFVGSTFPEAVEVPEGFV